ncbi:MAG: IS66 family transposase [Desulfuromonadaceae bacterium]|nr:IS66 family transposase [Desulfuromonadaceae bacterium]
MSDGAKNRAEIPNFLELLQQKDQRIHALEADLLTLKEQLTWLQKQVFGVKNERLIDLHDQLPLPGLDLGPQDAETESEQEEVHFKRRKTKKNRGKDTITYPDDLPVKRVELDIPAEEKICPETGNPLVKIGCEVSRKLARKPEQFYIVEYVRPKYASKTAPELGIKVAPLPDAIINRCPADESLLAYILTAKFTDHLPLYRLVEILKRADVRISRQTLSKWVLTLGEALSPLYEAMRAEVLTNGAIFVDETPIRLQVKGKSRCQQAYMWVYVGGGGGDPPYRFFEFQLNRNHEHPLKTLKEYQGFLHTDKYGAYEKLAKYEDITWCPCMAHVRRKFVEAENGDPELRRRILRKIRYLFMLERVAWARSPEERLRIRQQIEKPILEELSELVENRILKGGLLPKSNFSKALNYYQGLAPSLPNYLSNPDARLDNNVAERAIRPLTIGRKNWLFVGSEDGGRATATILSLVQTCRNLDINPQEYLEDVLRRIMSHPAKQIHELLPDQWLAARSQQHDDMPKAEGQDGLG